MLRLKVVARLDETIELTGDLVSATEESPGALLAERSRPDRQGHLAPPLTGRCQCTSDPANGTPRPSKPWWVSPSRQRWTFTKMNASVTQRLSDLKQTLPERHRAVEYWVGEIGGRGQRKEDA